MTIKEGMEQQALARLDRLEGYSEDSTSNLYDRVMVNDWEYPEIEGYAYAFPRGNGGERIRKSPVIIHGDWRKRKELVYFAYGSCMNEADFLRTCIRSVGVVVSLTFKKAKGRASKVCYGPFLIRKSHS